MSPIRVDFYLLNQANEMNIACRLIEKAYLRGHRIFIYCENQQRAEHLDELLWTFKDDSFIPHNLQGEGPEPPPPVQIGYGAEPRQFNDLLLNMTTTIPPFFIRFKRVIEIVSPDETAKELSRARYRAYRKSGCQLHTHSLEAVTDNH